MIERKIVIGLITSTEFCTQLKPLWNNQLIDSATAKRIAGWCWEYFDKYQKAPGKDIEGIYFSKLKAGNFPKVMAEEIEQEILPGLSKEYERSDFNLTYAVDEAKKHLSQQHIKIFTDSIQVLLSENKLQEAEERVGTFKPLEGASVSVGDFIKSLTQLKNTNLPHPTVFFKPWLKAGQITIIYGSFGSGKTLLSLLIGYMVGLKDHSTDDCEIGEWLVKNSTGCLYVDGEMGELEMAERLGTFEWLGRQHQDYRIRVLSIPEFQLATEDSFSLSERTNQLKIINWLKSHPTYKLIVLDSASTLFGLVEENSNSEWNTKINPFLRDLKAMGVACILLHHAGKDNKKGLRGASAMGAMAHNIFRLTNHVKKQMDDGSAWFVIQKDKYRAAGKNFKTFSLKFTRSENEKETNWEVTDNF